jgi:plastocyanin
VSGKGGFVKRSLLFSFVVAGAISIGLSSHSVLRASPIATSGAASTAAADTKSGSAVTIDNFSFSPATLTVPAGTTVVWTNKDDIPHTVVERNQKFRSKGLDTDDAYSYTFSEPGTYEYFCGMHPKMVGKVVVEAKK